MLNAHAIRIKFEWNFLASKHKGIGNTQYFYLKHRASGFRIVQNDVHHNATFLILVSTGTQVLRRRLIIGNEIKTQKDIKTDWKGTNRGIVSTTHCNWQFLKYA